MIENYYKVENKNRKRKLNVVKRFKTLFTNYNYLVLSVAFNLLFVIWLGTVYYSKENAKSKYDKLVIDYGKKVNECIKLRNYINQLQSWRIIAKRNNP